MRSILAFMVIGLAVAVTGCANLSQPRLLSPGSSDYQQARALRFDPYPDATAGPEIVGGRPRAFDVQAAEPVRAQQYQPPFGAFGY